MDKIMIRKRQYFLLLFFSACILCGCSGFSSHMDKMLNEYTCQRNAAYKVGLERDVILFVKHHIMVGDRVPGTNTWDKNGFTRTPKEKISWENTRFALYRLQTIPDLMQGVNEIFYDNDTGVFLVNKGIEINVDKDFFPADFDLLGRPQGHTREVMEAMVAEEPEYIHVLYGWTSSTAISAAGDHLAVVVADDPRYGSRISSAALAREIIHALGYQPQVDNDARYNLLHHAASGTSMSSAQVHALWDVINADDGRLKSISCAPEKGNPFSAD